VGGRSKRKEDAAKHIRSRQLKSGTIHQNMTNIKKIGDSQVEIEHEVPAEEFDRFFKLALKDFREKVELPGFRKGTVPERMVLEKIGDAMVLESAAELAIKDLWPKILLEEKIEAIGRPEFSITKLAKGNPLGLKIKTSVLRPIELADYKNIAKEANSAKIEEADISDAEIIETLEMLKKNNPARQVDEEKMKDAVRKNLELEKKRKAKDKHRMDLLDKIVNNSKIIVPDILAISELEKMELELKNSLKDMGLKWEDYLAHVKKTETELKDGWKDDALKRAKFGLVLREIASRENLVTPEKDLDSQVDKILLEASEEDRKKTSRADLKEHIFGRLQNEMVLALLENLK